MKSKIFFILFIFSLAFKVMAVPKKPVKFVDGQTSKSINDISISWEKDHPERKAWSQYAKDLIGGELFETFDSAKDATVICPKYNSLKKEQKVTVWTEFISGIVKYESNWKPTSWMTEKTMGIDPVTKKQVKSEGLMQLSYQDMKWAKYCRFDWEKDKKLDPDDPKKTIFDPFLNLDCGLKILSKQIQKKGHVIVSSGVYWSTLKENGRNNKIRDIVGMVQKTGLCN
ncbi:MAG: transglycosylase SLT domain-containing protein [Bdellovibrio sp.]